MKKIKEGNLTFSFPQNWHVEKYDEGNFFQKSAQKLPGTKTVDIMALSQDALFLIEIKDFRNYRIENKERLTNHELATEFSQKIRDTIAAMYGAYRSEYPSLNPYYKHLFEGFTQKTIMAVLFLEEDRSPNKVKRSSQLLRQQLRIAIRQQLKLFRFHCNIYNKTTLPEYLHWKVS